MSRLPLLRIALPLVSLPLLLLATVGLHAEEPADGELLTVKARDLELKVPAAWQQEDPASRLRLAQFKIKAVEGDSEGAELVVFNFGGGGQIEANIKRWIEQFQSEGRQVRIASGDSTQGKYVFVDVSGTYNKPEGPPVLQQTKPTPDYRAASAILVIEGKGVYFLKLVGPKKTVEANIAAYRDAFGAAKLEDEKVFDTEAEPGDKKP